MADVKIATVDEILHLLDVLDQIESERIVIVAKDDDDDDGEGAIEDDNEKEAISLLL